MAQHPRYSALNTVSKLMKQSGCHLCLWAGGSPEGTRQKADESSCNPQKQCRQDSSRQSRPLLGSPRLLNDVARWKSEAASLQLHLASHASNASDSVHSNLQSVFEELMQQNAECIHLIGNAIQCRSLTIGHVGHHARQSQTLDLALRMSLHCRTACACRSARSSAIKL